jgi:hypothetical protein
LHSMQSKRPARVKGKSSLMPTWSRPRRLEQCLLKSVCQQGFQPHEACRTCRILGNNR